MTNTNRGCLSLLLGNIQVKKQEETMPYRLRDDFLSPAELTFYHILRSMMGEYFTICTKVALPELFFVVQPNKNQSAFNRSSRKRVDFLVCSPKEMKPLFAIELDDQSHNRPDRVERDVFMDTVFKTAGLPLLHIPARKSYDIRELGVLFRNTLASLQNRGKNSEEQSTKILNLSTEESTAPNEAARPEKAPYCPKCGTLMVLRTAQKGASSGKWFWGCPNYPHCRTVIPID